jgi:hypothetical protein
MCLMMSMQLVQTEAGISAGTVVKETTEEAIAGFLTQWNATPATTLVIK